MQSYNAPSREVEVKLDFYFTDKPVPINRSNYLISFNLLEELGSDSPTSPVGDVSANELDIKLLNYNGIFSPSNPDSPYYGMMKAGVKVVVKMRTTDRVEWDDMGTFYVDDWYAEVTGLQATVTCYDKMQSILNAPTPILPVVKSTTYVAAFSTLFDSLTVAYNVDKSLDGELPLWYTLTKTSDTLKKLSNACLAASFCNRSGDIEVLDITTPKEVKAVLRDSDQIISANVVQSINRAYDGLKITVNNSQVSSSISLLDLKEFTVGVGTKTSEPLKFSRRPVAMLESISLACTSLLVALQRVEYTTDVVQVTITNEDTQLATLSLEATGRIVEVIKSTYTESGLNPLDLDNEYVQDNMAADKLDEVLSRYVASNLPSLTLSIRGNPTYHLGDKLTVKSDKYKLNFTGILQRAEYVYDGALRCDITLINSLVLEVV